MSKGLTTFSKVDVEQHVKKDAEQSNGKDHRSFNGRRAGDPRADPCFRTEADLYHVQAFRWTSWSGSVSTQSVSAQRLASSFSDQLQPSFGLGGLRWPLGADRGSHGARSGRQ